MTSHKTINKFKSLGTLLICSILSVLINIRFLIENRFSVMPGDRYDGMISAALLEHWFNVFKLNASWTEAGWAYPYEKTIAHGDASLISAILYAPFRLIGFDPFLSSLCSTISLQLIGYFSIYFLSKNKFNLDKSTSVLIAVLFTISNSLTIHSSRFNLLTVALAPLIIILYWNLFDAIRQGKSLKFYLNSLIGSMLVGIWTLSCFYMFFFFHLYLLIITTLLFSFKLTSLRKFYFFARSNIQKITIALIMYITSLAPFIYLYLPKSREVGTRTFDQALVNGLNPINLIQMGKDNFLWGNIYNQYFIPLVDANYIPSGEYYNLGLSPLLFFIFTLSIFFFRKSNDCKSRTFFVASIAVVISWLFIIRIDGKSLWIIPFLLIPGSKALNAIGTFQVVLLIPVLILAGIFLQKRFGSRSSMFLIIGSLLVIGELNRPYLNLDRKVELARINIVQQPPQDCQSFFVNGYDNQSMISGFPKEINEIYAHNVVAMMISAKYNIPTINGFTSFNVPDWSFQYDSELLYRQNIARYIERHSLLDVCELDLNSGLWIVSSPN